MFDIMFSPIKIGTMEVKNRIVMTAAEFSLGQTDGTPTERMIRYYEERAKGEVGLIIPGICRVNDMGATSTFTQLSMANDRNIEPMRKMADRIHAAGAKLCIQLHHPGRQGYASAINSLPLIIAVASVGIIVVCSAVTIVRPPSLAEMFTSSSVCDVASIGILPKATSLLSAVKSRCFGL